MPQILRRRMDVCGRRHVSLLALNRFSSFWQSYCRWTDLIRVEPCCGPRVSCFCKRGNTSNVSTALTCNHTYFRGCCTTYSSLSSIECRSRVKWLMRCWATGRQMAVGSPLVSASSFNLLQNGMSASTNSSKPPKP